MTEIYTYQTLTAWSEGVYREKGSKFLAHAFPCSSLEVLEEHLVKSRKAHPKARHHCWGCRMLIGEEIEERSTDDGEPSGTAGRPILGQIKSFELHNAAVMVVRYFGGTKLGAAGLIRAYKLAARDALQAGKLETIHRRAHYEIRLGYAMLPHLLEHTKRHKAEISDQNFQAENVVLKLAIPREDHERRLYELFLPLSPVAYDDLESLMANLSLDLTFLGND